MHDFEIQKTRLLREHEILRALLARVGEAAERAQGGDPLGAVHLRTALPPLRAAFEAHLGHEEEALAPVLARLDSWGPHRLEQMAKEHASQRRALALTAGEVQSGANDVAVARRALKLVATLLDDMAAEEIDLFDLAVQRAQAV